MVVESCWWIKMFLLLQEVLILFFGLVLLDKADVLLCYTIIIESLG